MGGAGKAGAIKFTLPVLVALIAIQVGFGAYGVIVAKFSDQVYFNKLIFSFLRDSCAAPLLFLLAAGFEGVRMIRLNEVPMFFLFGVTGMFGNQFLYIQGVSLTTPDLASAAQPLIPVFTALLALVTCMEPLPPSNELRGWLKLGGIAGSVCGAIFMTVFKDSDGGGKKPDNLFVGYLCLLGNCVSMAVYVLLQKRFIFNPDLPNTSPSFTDGRVQEARRPKGCNCLPCLGWVDRINLSRWSHFPVNVSAWSYAFGALCMGISSLYYVVKDRSQWEMDVKVLIPLSYAAIISSAMCYGLITWCTKAIPSTIVTAFWPLQVFVAFILSWFVLGEKLTLLQGVGGGLITFGLLAITYASHLDKQAADEAERHDNDKALTNPLMGGAGWDDDEEQRSDAGNNWRPAT